MDLPPVGIALVIAILVLSLGIHEAAHGWMALKCGDTTARDLGRITLNPLAHIDPIMTILLPAVLLYTTGMVFGGAKPVPVNFYNLRRPYRDMALVAAAGPASNVLIAVVLAFAHKLMVTLGLWGGQSLGTNVLSYGIFLNLLLAVFNMLPIPPLDGSRIMAWILPKTLRTPYVRLESIGLLLVMVLLMNRMLTQPILGGIDVMYRWVDFVVSFGGLW